MSDDVLREQNRALCSALADMTARMYGAEKRYEASVTLSAEVERLLMELLTDTDPERLVTGSQRRRKLIRAMERLQRIKRLKREGETK